MTGEIWLWKASETMFEEEIDRFKKLGPKEQDEFLDECLKFITVLLEIRDGAFCQSPERVCERCPLKN
jgi:hypothetical protein